ncbi:post-GPI attachment to proteins factor 3-like [Gossypium australe]|uniref:Post-GPI attachment to proteins factor 3-like n=1 Tax=Gossypium australe TaxID=47621 RepID=A0A5B6W427_9ROSI|nr:post-GPI attachment to proteins factor 3-like [Gossypium australe]
MTSGIIVNTDEIECGFRKNKTTKYTYVSRLRAQHFHEILVSRSTRFCKSNSLSPSLSILFHGAESIASSLEPQSPILYSVEKK